MTKEQIEEVRRYLSTEVDGLSEVDLVEVCLVATFEADRGDERITIEIRDIAPDGYPPELRYLCRAYPCPVETEPRRVAVSNGAETPEVAIGVTHWNELDRS